MITPLVSVIMPFKNEQAFIAEAIRSVLEAGCDEIEILCIDDGSVDGSIARIQEFDDTRIRILTSRGQGISAALNTALAEIRGSYIARCDADDRYLPGRFKHQLEILDSNPEIGAVCGSYNNIDPEGRFVTCVSEGANRDITEELRNGGTRSHLCTFLIRREYVENLRFRPWFETAEDTDFVIRLSEIGAVLFDQQTVYEYRIRAHSITHNRGNNRRIFFGEKCLEFARQRRSRGADDLDAGCPPNIPDEDDSRLDANSHLSALMLGQAWQLRREGKYFEAIRLGIRALASQPLSLRIWRSVAALIMKRGIC